MLLRRASSLPPAGGELAPECGTPRLSATQGTVAAAGVCWKSAKGRGSVIRARTSADAGHDNRLWLSLVNPPSFPIILPSRFPESTRWFRIAATPSDSKRLDADWPSLFWSTHGLPTKGPNRLTQSARQRTSARFSHSPFADALQSSPEAV
ncbi:hypothetical protein MTO96_009709 [Rhipicephalus appendiculatus]